MKEKYFFHKVAAFLLCLLAVVFVGFRMGLTVVQVMILGAFSLSILGTLFFWEFRLSFAFLGTVIVLFSGVTSMQEFIGNASIEIIFFLIGMMVLVGFLREIGLFTWLLQKALVMKHLSAKKFMIALIFTSGLLSCVLDEVSSILFMIMIILELCDFFEVEPGPFVVVSVLATNTGSAGTVIGNPIGIFIAAKGQLTFEDFLRFAFPLMIVSLLILTWIMFAFFQKQIRELDEKIKICAPNDIFVKLLSVPMEKELRIGFIISGATLCLIAIHHRIELLLGVERNTILLIAPLLSAAIIMMWRRHRARHYIEHEVEWWTLLFFIFLFAQAGMLSKIGVAETFAKGLLSMVANSKAYLITAVLFGSALVSSVLDNVVVVAGFIPVLNMLNTILDLKSVLWWALLFGACFGGNITVIGSTANIIAIGMLEKHRGKGIGFWYWLKIGSVVGILTLVFICLALLLLPYYK